LSFHIVAVLLLQYTNEMYEYEVLSQSVIGHEVVHNNSLIDMLSIPVLFLVGVIQQIMTV